MTCGKREFRMTILSKFGLDEITLWENSEALQKL